MALFEDVNGEIRSVKRYQDRAARAAHTASTIPRERVAMLNAAAEKHPFLSADVAMAVTRSPRPLAEHTFDLLAQLSTKRWMRDHPNGIGYGESLVTPAMRRARRGNLAAQGYQAANYAMGQARRGAEANQTAELREMGLLTEEGGLQSPVPLKELEGYSQQGVRLDPRIQKFREIVDRLAGDPEGEWSEVPFALPGGGVGKFRPPGPGGGEGGFFEPEPGVEAAPNVMDALGRLGDIRVPQVRFPGTQAPGDLSAAGPTSLTDIGRQGLMALNFPVQEAQGQIRNLYAWTHGRSANPLQPQSDYLISLNTGLDSGNGYLVDAESDVAKRRLEVEAERGQIAGHNVTAGRWLADLGPFDADSKPWMMMSGLVDLGVQLLDPSAYALGVAGKGIKLRDAFANPELYEKAGLWSGVRRSIAGDSALKTLDSKGGVAATERLTELTSPHAVYKALGRKVNLDLASEIADTRSVTETRGILQRELGVSIRSRSQFIGAGGGHLGLPAPATPIRDMPARGAIDATNKDIVGREVESWLFNAKATEDEIAPHIDRIARTTNRYQLNAAIRETMRGADGILARAGVDDPRFRKELTRLYEEATEENSKTWKDLTTAQRQTDDVVVVGGEAVPQAPARLYIEHAPDRMALPDARRIRRAVSDHQNLMKFISKQSGEARGELRAPISFLESVQNEIWKPVTLITRVAWPIRVIGEEQIRMAVAGYDSMFNHPISHMAGVIGKKKGQGIADDFLAEAAAQKGAIVPPHGDWVERPVHNGGRQTFHKSDLDWASYKRAVGSEISKLHADPISRQVAQTDSLDDVKEWFSRGPGLKFKSDMALEHPRDFQTPEQADAYIDSIARRIRQQTGGNEELLEAIRTGTFRGSKLIDDGNLDKGFLKDIDPILDEFGPSEIVGDKWLSIRSGKGLAGAVASWDRAVDKMFGWMMTSHTNRFSRIPVFTQTYWDETERIIAQGGNEAAKQAAIAQAGKWSDWGPLSDSRRTVARLEKITARGDLGPEDIDKLAKGYALDRTKDLLYDLSRKGRNMDALRLIMPFGEAWREVMTRWFGHGRRGMPLGLMWENPRTIRRTQQLFQGARGSEFGEFMGVPEVWDEESEQMIQPGFFSKNQWGEEIFIWPGTQLLTDKLLDVPVPLTGRVQGLSMFGTVMPGLGPVAQFPVGWLLSTKSGPQEFKQVLSDVLGFKLGPFGTVEENILPFGAESGESQTEPFNPWTYAPPWIKAAAQWASQGDLDSKQWNQTVMEMAGALKSTGDYGDSIGDQNRLYEDAADKARHYYGIKALAAIGAPSAPDGEWMLRNAKDGRWLRATALADELRTMREDDFETADGRMLEKYGPDVMAVLGTTMTTTSIYAVPTTKDGVEWVMANPGVEDRLPNTYGFFAPEGGEEDFSIYNSRFREGGAIRLNPQDWISLLNDTKGNTEYRSILEEIEGKENTKAGKILLAEERERIWSELPGWRSDKGKLSKATDQEFIAELYRAARDKAIRDTDAGKGLRKYLAIRDDVKAWAESKDRAWPGTAQDTLPGRILLDEEAQKLIREHPAFKTVYDYILSRETEEEEVTRGQG